MGSILFGNILWACKNSLLLYSNSLSSYLIIPWQSSLLYIDAYNF